MTFDPNPDREPLPDLVRRNIRAAIVRAGYTQVQFASRVLGKNASWLSRRLRKEDPTDVTVADLEVLAIALGTTPEDLIRR